MAPRKFFFQREGVDLRQRNSGKEFECDTKEHLLAALHRVVPDANQYDVFLGQVPLIGFHDNEALPWSDSSYITLTPKHIQASASTSCFSSQPDSGHKLANALIQGFESPKIFPNELAQCLAEKLKAKLPVNPLTFQEIWRRKPKIANRSFVLEGAVRADRISAAVCNFLLSTEMHFYPGEINCKFLWDLVFCGIWDALCSAAGGTGCINWHRDDYSGASFSLQRADLMLFCYGKLIMKIQEKPLYAPSFDQAIFELKNKMDVLDPAVYGDMKYMIGVTTLGDACQFFALRKATTTTQHVECHPLTSVLELTDINDRITCLVASINILRLACTWEPSFTRSGFGNFGLTSLVKKYGALRNIVRIIEFKSHHVNKIICPWYQHEREYFSKLEYVRRAYTSIGWESPSFRSMSSTFKLKMKFRGEASIPSTYLELLIAVRCVLELLDKLHKDGLVHRDVKWENVLLLKHWKWILIDYETVWEADQPALCRLKLWDDDMARVFMKKSDLKLLGKMLQDSRVLSLLDTHMFQFSRELVDGAFLDAGAAYDYFERVFHGSLLNEGCNVSCE